MKIINNNKKLIYLIYLNLYIVTLLFALNILSRHFLLNSHLNALYGHLNNSDRVRK